MGMSACGRLETACARMDSVPTESIRVQAHVIPADVDPDDVNLCGAVSMSHAEKLLLSPLTRRCRSNARLSVELASGCVEINPREIRPGTKIGSGTWSMVYAGEWRGKRAALKMFRHAGSNAKEQEKTWQMFLKEARVLQDLDSPRLAKLFGVFVGSDGSPCIVAELLMGGTLHELLHGRRKSHKLLLEPAHRFLLSIHIAEGLQYLHERSMPVVHCDIKSKNIVIARDPPDCGPPHAAKIIDFGLAEYLGFEGDTEEMVATDSSLHGSAVYMAPECFVKPSRITAKVDVWAFGCVLAEIFGGAPPHPECEDLEQVINKLLVQQLPPDISSHADLAAGAPEESSIQQLLEGCFAFAVDERWSAASALEQLRVIATKYGFEPLGDDDVD